MRSFRDGNGSHVNSLGACVIGSVFRGFILLEAGEKGTGKRGDAGIVDEDAAFARAFAVVLDAPVGFVADASRLANDEVGRGEVGVELPEIVFQATIVVNESSADPFDDSAIIGDVAASSAHAEDGLVQQLRFDGDRWREMPGGGAGCRAA